MTKLPASLDKREMEGFQRIREKQKPWVTLGPQVSRSLRSIQRGAAGAAPARHASLWHFISRASERSSRKMSAKWAADIIIIIIIKDKQPCDCFPRDQGQNERTREEITSKEMHAE